MLDNVELVQTLEDTKTKAVEVSIHHLGKKGRERKERELEKENRKRKGINRSGKE